MSRYLLDTNAISRLMRDPAGSVARRVTEVGGKRAVYTSVIVLAELRFGIAKVGSRRLADRLDAVLTEMPVAPFSAPSDEVYADLRVELERRGTPIGTNDLWIAAQALQDQSVVVTDDVIEFGHVPNLKVENWLRPEA